MIIGVNVDKVLEPKLSYSYPKFIPLASAWYARMWKSCGATLSPILLWLSISHCDMWIDERIERKRKTWDKKGHLYHKSINAFVYPASSLLRYPLPYLLSSQFLFILQDFYRCNIFFWKVFPSSLMLSSMPLLWTAPQQHLVLRCSSALSTMPYKNLAYCKHLMNVYPRNE